MTLLQISHWVCQWKNFENRSTFGEVTDKSIVACLACFFDSQCSSNSMVHRHQLSGRPSYPLAEWETYDMGCDGCDEIGRAVYKCIPTSAWQFGLEWLMDVETGDFQWSISFERMMYPQHLTITHFNHSKLSEWRTSEHSVCSVACRVSMNVLVDCSQNEQVQTTGAIWYFLMRSHLFFSFFPVNLKSLFTALIYEQVLLHVVEHSLRSLYFFQETMTTLKRSITNEASCIFYRLSWNLSHLIYRHSSWPFVALTSLLAAFKHCVLGFKLFVTYTP